MEESVAAFMNLEAAQQKDVHLALLTGALSAFEQAYPVGHSTSYTENLCGTQKSFDHSLPRDALAAIESGEDLLGVQARYSEPLAALQEESLCLPEPLQYGYYGIYNAFRLHVLGEPVEPWLIANQALSVLNELEVRDAFTAAVGRARASRLAG